MATIQQIKDWFTKERRDVLASLAPMKYGGNEEGVCEDPVRFLDNQLNSITTYRDGSMAQATCVYHLKKLKAIIMLTEKFDLQNESPPSESRKVTKHPFE